MDARRQPSPEELRALLGEVVANGAPAQRRHAQALLMRLTDGTVDPSTFEESMLLIDAFRHDPYLWR